MGSRTEEVDGSGVNLSTAYHLMCSRFDQSPPLSILFLLAFDEIQVKVAIFIAIPPIKNVHNVLSR